MTADKVLEKHLELMIGKEDDSFHSMSELKAQPEWAAVIDAMNEFAGIKKELSSDSLSFKEQLINDFIPRIELMEAREKIHLHHLIDIEAPLEFIQMSQKTQFHFADKIKEYKEYAEHIQD